MTLQVNFNVIEVSENLEEQRPEFADIEPNYNLDKIDQGFENLVVIGNGGSITSLRAFYYAFFEEADKHLDIVSTMDPDRLHQVLNHTEPENTLVMPISKSGTTIGVIESLLFFINRGYDFNPLTTPGTPLHQIAENYDREIIEHQEVGGRFSGLTNTALAPAELIGLDSEVFREGGEEAYENSRDTAARTAEALFEADKRGFNEVLTPFYSSRMFGFYPLFIQLMHETVCKQGEGQTFYGDQGPEYQHHTNQRLFGGRQDVIPLFLRSNHRKQSVEVPDKLSSIQIKGRNLSELDSENLSEALNSEFEGVRNALEDEEMPYIDLKLEDTSYHGYGQLMAFLQLVAFYSARLRRVDPLTQPNVEKSKKIGIEERFK